MSNLKIASFNGTEASVNAYVFMNDENAIVIDALRNSQEATEFAAFVKGLGRTVQAIFITHGHPDHYIGMRVLKAEFPQARLLVANQSVKESIIGFSQWMESIGWLEGEPKMKVKSDQNPDGFDYDAIIEPLNESSLSLNGGGTLEVKTDYPAVEHDYMTTLYSSDLNALFSADFVYNGVHAWAGPEVTREKINSWINTVANLKTKHSADVAVYPGHGESGGPELFDVISQYLQTFLDVTAAASTSAEAKTEMENRYPTYQQADFLLAFSVDYHVPGEG